LEASRFSSQRFSRVLGSPSHVWFPKNRKSFAAGSHLQEFCGSLQGCSTSNDKDKHRLIKHGGLAGWVVVVVVVVVLLVVS